MAGDGGRWRETFGSLRHGCMRCSLQCAGRACSCTSFSIKQPRQFAAASFTPPVLPTAVEEVSRAPVVIITIGIMIHDNNNNDSH